MKKILFLIAIVWTVQITNAQGILQLFDHSGNYVTNGQSVFVHVENLNDFETVSDEYFVRNNSDEDLNIKCVRNVVSAVEGTGNLFCAMGSCFGPDTDETPNAYLLNANTTMPMDYPFTSHYLSNGFSGTSEISYKFYNVDNPNDSVSFSITYSDTDVVKNSLQLFDAEGSEIVYGQNIEVSVDDLELFETVSPESFIMNNSDVALDIVCERTVLEEIEGSVNYFCVLGRCLGADISITDSYNLRANTQIGEDYPFSSHYTPNNNPGLTKLHFRYYDINNVFDEFSFTITFDGTTAVSEISQKTAIMAYPNPASEQVQFNISDNEISNAQLVIYNAVGKIVKVVQVSNQSILDVNLTDLTQGIYLFRLESGTQMSKTSKLIIQ
jgi:hypothetical protein